MAFTTIIAEADEIAYKIAASAEKTGHIVNFENGEIIDLADQYSSTELKQFYKSQGISEESYQVETYKIDLGLDIMVQNMIGTINVLWKLHSRPGAAKFGIVEPIKNLEFWLSNSDRSINFRYNVAKTEGKHGFGYKAGRGEKPKHIQAARDYLIDMYGAQETQFGEADDAIAIKQNKETILCSLDKDLLMIPGVHYNLYYDELFFVPEGIGGAFQLGKKMKPYGLLCFYTQLLCGDDIDNIPGCQNIDKLHFKNYTRFSMEYALTYLQRNGDDTEQSYFDLCANVYKHQYNTNWKEVLLEVADLVWICRSKTVTGRQYLLNKGFL
jgi:hypothetical protein